jgi:hypothetical protein
MCRRCVVTRKCPWRERAKVTCQPHSAAANDITMVPKLGYPGPKLGYPGPKLGYLWAKIGTLCKIRLCFDDVLSLACAVARHINESYKPYGKT